METTANRLNKDEDFLIYFKLNKDEIIIFLNNSCFYLVLDQRK